MIPLDSKGGLFLELRLELINCQNTGPSLLQREITERLSCSEATGAERLSLVLAQLQFLLQDSTPTGGKVSDTTRLRIVGLQEKLLRLQETLCRKRSWDRLEAGELELFLLIASFAPQLAKAQ